MEPSSYFSGKVIHYDCRGGKTRPAFHGGKNGKIKMLQWNIERGYKLPGIIEELRNIDADILSIQEIDVNCERSGNIDTGVQIASELGLNYVFYQEFEEIHSPLRSSATQGGGYHGVEARCGIGVNGNTGPGQGGLNVSSIQYHMISDDLYKGRNAAAVWLNRSKVPHTVEYIDIVEQQEQKGSVASAYVLYSSVRKSESLRASVVYMDNNNHSMT